MSLWGSHPWSVGDSEIRTLQFATHLLLGDDEGAQGSVKERFEDQYKWSSVRWARDRTVVAAQLRRGHTWIGLDRYLRMSFRAEKSQSVQWFLAEVKRWWVKTVQQTTEKRVYQYLMPRNSTLSKWKEFSVYWLPELSSLREFHQYDNTVSRMWSAKSQPWTETTKQQRKRGTNYSAIGGNRSSIFGSCWKRREMTTRSFNSIRWCFPLQRNL